MPTTFPRLTISLALLLCGCATHPKGHETDGAKKQIVVAENANRRATGDAKEIKHLSSLVDDAVTKAAGNLSRADAKAEVIKQWFRQHRK